jgi:hypothetical protein
MGRGESSTHERIRGELTKLACANWIKKFIAESPGAEIHPRCRTESP